MLKAAFANSPVPTPSGIRGPSAEDLYLRLKAEGDLTDLVSSTTPLATAGSMGSAVLGASAIPLLLAGIVPSAMAAGGINSRTIQKTYIKALLEEKGLSPKDAAAGSDSVYQYIATQRRMPSQKLRGILADAAGGWNIHEYGKPSSVMFTTPTRGEAIELIKRKYPGRSESEMADGIANLISKAKPPAALTSAGILPEASLHTLLESAEKAFNKSHSTSDLLAPLAKAHALNFTKGMGRAAPITALLAIPAGIAAYMRARKKRETLGELRERYAQSRRNYSPDVEKTAQALFHDWEDLSRRQQDSLLDLVKEAGLASWGKKALVGLGLLGGGVVKAEVPNMGARLARGIATDAVQAGKKKAVRAAVPNPVAVVRPPSAASATQGIQRIKKVAPVNVPRAQESLPTVKGVPLGYTGVGAGGVRGRGYGSA